ncbi:MAG: DUF1566 domain-containing protein [Desulfobacterales bacterium]|nr:DUF1566 domain-containing protein [Desulfobacterales bacterium]
MDSFLQMVQMEKTSCTLKVTTEEDMGWLFILKGNLIAAETGAISGMEAACTIISWEDSVIEIDNACDKKEDEVKQPLMNVLMEGLRLRDENRIQSGGKPSAPVKVSKPPDSVQPSKEKTDAPKDSPKQQPSAADRKPVKKPRPSPFDTPEPHKRSMGRRIVIASVVVIMVGGGYLAFSILGGQPEKSYKKIIAQVETTAEDSDKIILLQSFINANKPGEQTQDAEEKIKAIKTRLEQADFSSLEKTSEANAEKGNFDKAIALYHHHLNKYPASTFKGRIDKRIENMASRMEERDFEQLTTRAGELGADRIELYLAYLKNHPKGKHKNEVEKRIGEMSTEYFIHIEAQILDKDMKEDWASCIELAKKYMDIYPADQRAAQLAKLQTIWEEKTRETRIFETLKRSADSKGTNYEAAAMIYANYLRSYPNSYVKDKVNQQLTLLEQRINAQRLGKETHQLRALLAGRAERFVENGDGTVTDKKTGLRWSTLDGLTVNNNCMGYDSAMDYVKALRTGGHADWRLPTPEELVTLYKKAPFFPETEPTWYWTSKTNRRYMGGWVTDVEVVTSTNSTEWVPEVRDSRACGSVRAVRSKK